MKEIPKWRLSKRDSFPKVFISALILLCMVSAGQAVLVTDFSATPTSGPVPLVVSFTDSSTGNITGWQWNFGDGHSSFLENPVHVYLFAGSFDVNLTVFRDGDSNTTIKQNYITATYPEIAFYLDPNQTPGSLVVNKYYAETDPETGKFLAEFNAFPTNLTDGYTKFYWDFDDGKKDDTKDSSTTHSYRPGIYNPCVKVHNDGIPDQVLHLPTLLIVTSPGMSIDDVAEDGVV